jgi:hypothetical protein
MDRGTEIHTCCPFLCVTVPCLLLGRHVVRVWHVFFFFVVEIYDLLLSLLNKFPVGYVLDIEDHVSSKHKLS